MSNPRAEHPRPQFVRERWINLNGTWSFDFDFGVSGIERGLAASRGFERRILVPFCPESDLSGIGHKDFIPAVWYHRSVEIPRDWSGSRILLHFGGVDYDARVFVDGRLAGRHWGGASSFSLDITRFVHAGKTHDLVVYAQDDIRSGVQPCGKQRPEYAFVHHGCSYTRTTGIWSTVWMEALDPLGLGDAQIVADLDGGRFVVTPRFHEVKRGLTLRVRVLAGGRSVGEASGPACDAASVSVALADARPWSPADPFLYDLELAVFDGARRIDVVSSYSGLRKVATEGNRILLNNEPIYLRLVLDQGFYPDGVWTAPDDAALRRDIELSMAAGFNGARLHQKVFDERFHYWADRLGYLTWGEFPSWGVKPADPVGARNLLTEWAEVVVRDRNHPSIIAWTPLNETGEVEPDPGQHQRFHQDLHDLTRALDPTRPVNDASGYVHIRTDLWTVHSYLQQPEELGRWLAPDAGGVRRCVPDREAAYTGQPYLIDEFGGIKWIPLGTKPWTEASWGYGEGPKTEEEFYLRLEGQVDAILSFDHVTGYCYTQLTDVEQEQNGIYTFDRSPKFDMRRIRTIFGKSRPLG
jgi:beta-galactosidase/beta-glucuronidase